MGKKTLRPPAVMLLLALMVVVCALSIAIGSRVIPLSDVWHTLWADNAPGAPDAVGVVHSLGIPRTVLGLIVGSAIGAAGALTQGPHPQSARHPGILGVNAGAACAVVDRRVGVECRLESGVAATDRAHPGDRLRGTWTCPIRSMSSTSSTTSAPGTARPSSWCCTT